LEGPRDSEGSGVTCLRYSNTASLTRFIPSLIPNLRNKRVNRALTVRRLIFSCLAMSSLSHPCSNSSAICRSRFPNRKGSFMGSADPFAKAEGEVTTCACEGSWPVTEVGFRTARLILGSLIKECLHLLSGWNGRSEARFVARYNR
jgi:hypothetical protein